MNLFNGSTLFTVIFGGVSAMQGQAVTPPQSFSTRCGDLTKMQIENATISEAIEVTAGQPVSVGGSYGPPVLLKSLPAEIPSLSLCCPWRSKSS